MPIVQFALWAATGGVPDHTVAAPTDRGSGYVLVAPGPIAAPVGQAFDVVKPGFHWKVGGGYRSPPMRGLRVTLGGVLEHVPLNEPLYPPLREDHDIRMDLVRALAEIRLGGGTGRTFGYALLQGGYVALAYDFGTELGGETRGATHGISVGGGTGVQWVFWRGLFGGIEVGVDLPMWFDLSLPIAYVDVGILVGWNFGTRGRV